MGLDSIESNLFKFNWLWWKFLGLVPPKNKYSFRYYAIYTIVLNCMITLFFPFHLMAGVIYNTSNGDLFRALALNITSFLCSAKTIIVATKLKNIRQISEINKQLNKRIEHPIDIAYYKDEILIAKRFIKLFVCMCYSTLMAAESSVLISGLVHKEWRLMYKGYFPFDIYATTCKYWIAHSFQVLSFIVQLSQNATNDTYSAIGIINLVTQIRLLGNRASRIGYDGNSTLKENNAELIACICDYKKILEFLKILEDAISLPVFFGIMGVGINMCIVIIYLIFFADSAFLIIFHTIYLLALPLEIFPCCYYGSRLQLELEHIPRAIFASNWFDQSSEFKLNMKIFVEQSLKQRPLMAAGTFQINLDSFKETLKGAYSLFSVLMNTQH